jgi:hypothetical protein
MPTNSQKGLSPRNARHNSIRECGGLAGEIGAAQVELRVVTDE